ncbi:MAG: LysM peptidoglycan-binding domain-containing protein [Thermodesulfobacteriota bacterium]|nr:LysM peptidoglycan-binding domain-containing protein [Thermodesulfobacteriota bacterium]
MKRLCNIYLLLIVLFFFTGCAGVRDFLGDIADKIAEKNSEKAPEGTKVLPASYYLGKALEYEKKDELQTALFYMQIAGTLNPDSTKIPEKIASLNSTIDHKAKQHFTTGVEFCKKRRFKDARKQFLTTLRYAPGHKEALNYLKNRLHPKEYLNYKVKEKDTLKDISKKFYKDPSKDFLIAYFNNLKTDKKPVPGTFLEIPVLGSEFTRPPIDIRIELIKAESLLIEKRSQEALDIAEKILEYDHLNKKASDLKNSAYYQIGIELSGQKKYPEAIKMFKKVTPEYQGVKEAIQHVINKELVKANNLLKEKQYEQVFAVAGKILEYDKSNKAAEDLINTAFCQQGKDLIIRKNYTQALNVLNSANPQYDCVKKTISDVYKAKKKQAEAHYLKGVKHFLNEELQSAIKEWEKTLALNPEHKKAKKNINNARSLLEKLEKVK